MNSIQLEIGGKKRAFSFGLGFLGELLEATGLEITEIIPKLNKNPYKYIPEIMYFSTEYETKKAGEIVDFTKYDVAEWIESEPDLYASKPVKTFLEELVKSLIRDVPESEKGEGDKDLKKN